jgi:V8-like Glu-specific endopeptidase
MYAPKFEADGDLAVIGPVDSRVQEINTTHFPWNTIVHLCRDFGDGTCRGCSGILIGRRLVLTAAHCLWSIVRAAAPRRILVVPGRRDRLTKPFGAIESREYWIPRGFIKGPDRQSWDWGIIRLSRDVPAGLHRFAKPQVFSDAAFRRLIETSRVTIAGYPSDRPVGTMWRHLERIVRFGPRRLFHTVDTCPGHSGSAILARRGEELSIIGIHTAGILDAEGRSHGCNRATVLAPAGSVNSGVRVVPDVLNAIADPAAMREGPQQMLRFP